MSRAHKALARLPSIASTCALAAGALFGASLLLLRLWGITPLIVTGSSMEPAIPLGSLVYVAPCTFQELEVGDCVSWQMNESTICTHRVVHIDAATQTLSTKGDANDACDVGTVDAQAVLGKVVLSVPYVGRMLAFISTPYGAGAGLCLLAFLIGITTLSRLARSNNSCMRDSTTI